MTTKQLPGNGQRRSPLRPLLGVAVCLAALSSQTAGAQCTRENLSRLVDDFLSALSANDPAGLDVASDLKFTENGRIMALGDGLWRTAGEITFSRSAIDVEQCGMLTQAVMDEDGVDTPTIYGVRLRVNGNAELTDIETYVARSTEFGYNPEGVPVEDGDDLPGADLIALTHGDGADAAGRLGRHRRVIALDASAHRDHARGREGGREQ